MSILQERLSRGRTLMPYLTASDPSPYLFLQAALGAAEGGAAAIEVGVPFSDPVADGPVIQAAHLRALSAGGGVDESLHLVARLKSLTAVPVVVFTYFNPVLAYGATRFLTDARASGADGVLVLDLPPEEEPEWCAGVSDAGLDPVVLHSPNTSAERARTIVSQGRGFVYVVSREGVTGTHAGSAEGLAARIASLRQLTPLPLAIGFGVRSHEDVKAAWNLAECSVVGSAFVDRVHRAPPMQVRNVARSFVRELLGKLEHDEESTP